jgi:hypothetical protein
MSGIKYLIDENLPSTLETGLMRREPVWMSGESGRRTHSQKRAAIQSSLH